MAVKIGFNSATTFGASGSFYGSEVVINVPVGPAYLSQNSQPLLGLPTWLQLVTSPAQSVDIQYTPDAGTTWISCRQGTGTLIFADTAGSYRLFGQQPAGTVDVRAVPIKQA